MGKFTGLVVIAALLLYYSSLAFSFRLDQALHSDIHPNNQNMDMVDSKEDGESCELGEGAEECLMRRTLAAHIDYIYTQNHNKP